MGTGAGQAPERRREHPHSRRTFRVNAFVGCSRFGYEGDRCAFCSKELRADTCLLRLLPAGCARISARTRCCISVRTARSEFMPGKQAGMSGRHWPERLIGAMPNLYLYASNNPSEGALAKRRLRRRSVSYLTPSVTGRSVPRPSRPQGFRLERWRDPDSLSLTAPISPSRSRRRRLRWTSRSQCRNGRIRRRDRCATPVCARTRIRAHSARLACGYATPGATERQTPLSIAQVGGSADLPRDAVVALCETGSADAAISASGGALGEGDPGRLDDLGRIDAPDARRRRTRRHRPGRWTDATYVPPGGDLMRTPAVLPTGRNLHGFDPFHSERLRGARRAAGRHADRASPCRRQSPSGMRRGRALGFRQPQDRRPPLAQALALLGARPRLDSYGRVAGAELIPLSELQRPRIDIVATLSGIFRDLLPVQVKLLAQACHPAAAADEPLDQNFARKHALAYQQQHNCDLETAALRVFSNAEGAYGANVNHLIDCGRWNDEDELAEAFAAARFRLRRAGQNDRSCR